jgi:hypothetical protein
MRPATYATHKEFIWLSSDENNIYINAAPRDCDPAKHPTEARIQVPLIDIYAALAESKPDWRFFAKAVRNAIAAADANAAPIREAAEEERRAKEEADKQREKEHQNKLKKADAYKTFLETPQHIDEINKLVNEGYLDLQSLNLPPDRKQDLVNAGLYPEEQELPDNIDR